MDQSLLSMFDLTGRAAIVTGASRGLGVSFARGLVKAGCDVALVARDFAALTKIADELRPLGPKVIPIRADVRNPRDVESMVQQTLIEFGRIDTLVNNAGISAVAPAEDMTAEQWQGVIDTNLTGLFHCAQCVGRHMLRAGSGRIINIASMYGISAASFVPQVSYVASKSGVLGLTRELAIQWGPRGVQVVALAPGFFRSDQTIWAFEENKELGEKLLAKVPMGRMGKLEELEASIVYLASPAAGYMNGQALVIDGGFLAW
ncbi:MAG TPA: SDR family oxidoreductase [Terriglobia bacterium]|nr:SDR family oxidoreductase [Terriglobia bacterium]